MSPEEAYRVDPVNDDLIRRLVEQRAEVRAKQKAAEKSGDREVALQLNAIQQAMKATANATSYGSAIELNPIEHRKPEWVTVHQPDGTSYRTRVDRTEEPGKWFHPLIATLVAGGGRLMLAAAMRLVADQGGHYVFCDTDSLFIVATQARRTDRLPRRITGNARRATSDPGVVLDTRARRRRSLRVAQSLPHDSRIDPQDRKRKLRPNTGEQRQIECLSIAAKRYGALYA